MKAVSDLQIGRLDEAESNFKKFLRGEPKHFGALNLYAVLLMQLNRFDEAEPLLRKAVRVDTRSDKTFYNYGLVLKKLGKFEESFEAFSQAIALNPVSAETWNNRGTVLNDLHRFDEAIADFDKAVSIAPNYAEALYNKGRALFHSGRLDEAMEAHSQAARLKIDFVDVWIGLADVAFVQSRYDEAISLFQKALTISRSDTAALMGLGHTYLKLNHFDTAEDIFNKVISADPSHELALVGKAHVELGRGRHDRALELLQQAVALTPTSTEAWTRFGYFCLERNWSGDAISMFQKAIKLDQNSADAWRGLAQVYGYQQSDWTTALAGFEKAIAIKPDVNFGQGGRTYAAAQICLWENIHEYWQRCRQGIAQKKLTIDPFSFLPMPSTAEEQLACARLSNSARFLPNPLCLNKRPSSSRSTIRIAYISGDFRVHAVSILLVGFIETHNRSKFETIALSVFPTQTTDSFSERVRNAFDEFHDVSSWSDLSIAEFIKNSDVDILVDLSGNTAHGRPDVFALHPAPIQVNYLGYPGTMGSDAYDYIIADHIIIPPQHEKSYSEKVVRLPDTYQPNDRKRIIADLNLKRVDAGLPEYGFVFCCFNNNYKITPDIFGVWMNLLKQVKDSVLWLLTASEATQYNLRKEAEAQGVDPERIVFTKYVSPAEHLARHQFADLFLDTLYYNAHTTASDALWMGLPLVTCLGSTFPSRVAASLLSAAGLPELITTSLEDYEALALKLALDPALLASIKTTLIANRLTVPLFDTERYTRHLEAAYTTMWELAQRGEPPKSFDVEPS